MTLLHSQPLRTRQFLACAVATFALLTLVIPGVSSPQRANTLGSNPALLKDTNPSRESMKPFQGSSASASAPVDGVVAEVTVVQSPSSLTMSVAGVSVEAAAGIGGRNELALTPDGRIRMVGGKSITVAAKGFAPRSTVDVWVYPRKGDDQTYIGSFEGDDNGSIDLEIEIPGGLGSGSADLVVSGTNTSGSKLVVGVPVSIEYERDAAGFGWSVLAGLLFAVGGLFSFLVMRRQSMKSDS